MTIEEVMKLGVSPVIGLCELCMCKYTCEYILEGFNKPDDCEGPEFPYFDQW